MFVKIKIQGYYGTLLACGTTLAMRVCVTCTPIGYTRTRVLQQVCHKKKQIKANNGTTLASKQQVCHTLRVCNKCATWSHMQQVCHMEPHARPMPPLPPMQKPCQHRERLHAKPMGVNSDSLYVEGVSYFYPKISHSFSPCIGIRLIKCIHMDHILHKPF